VIVTRGSLAEIGHSRGQNLPLKKRLGVTDDEATS